MYSERDMQEINRKICKNFLVLTPVAAAIIAVYVFALARGVEWLAMTMGPLLFVAICYALLAYLIPNFRYRRFLRDMQTGLSRDLRGTVVDVSGAPEMQDGARVLPVRILLTEEQDERIVYLNASKQGSFPAPGAEVLLNCYGRHIRQVSAV